MQRYIERRKHFDASGSKAGSKAGKKDDREFDYYGNQHFQILGFDVLLGNDEALTPVVLEANVKPYIFDIGLRRQIVFDMLVQILQPIRNGEEAGKGDDVGGDEDGLLVMAALAEDWSPSSPSADAGSQDRLLHPEEWCAQHWRWRQQKQDTGAAAAAEDLGAGTGAAAVPPLAPPLTEAAAAAAAGAGGRGFSPLFL